MNIFHLSIRTDGPAFQHHPATEIARILRALADEFDRLGFVGAWPRPLHDLAGRRVGNADLTDRPAG
ncbi:hypothetical protein FK498_12770 [Elioraea sp. Yellowstone]|jgi:hypothetical protein|uniref:hypothetical protein n=1 Tax=Elioraea sp. Yellowstone TaxID=2592070 RepID=UPI00114E42F1|nr:hypothetical protein [Elioraea sp. Yellowstone]TQF77414.1 hypothetical protein FK498_12770 [Elioraea sp. Yellowstone]